MEELIQSLKNDLFEKIDSNKNQLENKIDVNTKLIEARIDSKIVKLNERLDKQEEDIKKISKETSKIKHLEERVEKLESNVEVKKKSYAEALMSNKNDIHEETSDPKILTTETTSKVNDEKLTNQDLFNRSRKIIGLYPIDDNDLERNTIDKNYDNETIIERTVEEFLTNKLGFHLEQVKSVNITNVQRTKKVNGKTVYVTFNSQFPVTQIFWRNVIVRNQDLNIFNYVSHLFYDRYHTLTQYCKTAQENNTKLWTKVLLGSEDIIFQEKL